MKKQTEQFIGFAFLFFFLWVATKIFEQIKDLDGWVLFLGILWIAFQASKDNNR